jgi:hypothetical protein
VRRGLARCDQASSGAVTQVWHRMVSPGGVGLGDAGVDRLVAVRSGSFGQDLAGGATLGKVGRGVAAQVRRREVRQGSVWPG